MIGRCSCPVCESTRASLRVSTKRLAYVVCDACNSQTFARSDRSDDKLRARLIERAGAVAAAPELEPTKDEPVVPKVAPVARPVAPEPKPTPAPSGAGWGMLA